MDKFFKEKLENHSIPPAQQSWEKVETKISKKNNLALVLRVAAAVLLAGLFVTVIINQAYQEKAPAVADNEAKNTEAPRAKNEEESPTKIQSTQDHSVVESHRKRVAKTHSEETSGKIIQPEATVTPDPVVLIPEEQLVAEVQPEPARKKKLVLVYSLPTVAKTTDPALVGPEEEKRSGLQKVMDVAMEVKSGDNPLGDLRQAKDELFAQGFRKDKDKSKNH